MLREEMANRGKVERGSGATDGGKDFTKYTNTDLMGTETVCKTFPATESEQETTFPASSQTDSNASLAPINYRYVMS